MPVSAYYGGHGREVMAEMKKRYGKRGENVFYATAKAKGQEPKHKRRSHPAMDGLMRAKP